MKRLPSALRGAIAVACAKARRFASSLSLALSLLLIGPIATMAMFNPREVALFAGIGNYVQVTSTPGSTGQDFSANQPTLPNIGANFGSSGPYANYVLVATMPAKSTRVHWRLENDTGLTVVVIRDDGTAANGGAPVNASIWAITGTTAAAQGGADGDEAFKGRIQVYAPAALTGNQFLTLAQE